jgi:hypothetical protein
MPGAETIAHSTGGALVGLGLGEPTVRGVRKLPCEQHPAFCAVRELIVCGHLAGAG